jgi:hypothetical protein
MNFYNGIFGIGLPRTGTTSLAKALRTLGYKGENYCVLRKEGTKDGDAKAFKIDNGFFKIYKELFWECPNSKFILTTRDVGSWKKSINKFSTITDQDIGLPHISTYVQDVLKFFSNRGALRNLLVVDLFDNDCDCACKWKNLYEFLEPETIRHPRLELGSFPHVISHWGE